MHPSRRAPQNLKIRSFAATAAQIAVVLFHLVLLVPRLADGSILHPAVALKWLLSALLGAGVLAFQHFAPAQSRGPRAVAIFWLLVLLLHVAVPLTDTGARYDLAATAPLAVLLPTAAVAVLLFVTTLILSLVQERHRLAPVASVRRADGRARVSPRGPPLG